MGSNIHCVEDARRIAERKLPQMVFDYIDGAAGSGSQEVENRQAFKALRLRQRVMRNVEERSLACHVFGKQARLPFGIAPMGFGNMSRPGADLMLARMAARHNIPVGVSTAATTRLEAMIEAAQGHAWFQLYYIANHDVLEMLASRAEKAGYETLVLTVDVPEVGRRPRELRHNFGLPFRMNARQFLDCALHPGWSLRMLAAGAPTLANFGGEYPEFDRKASRAGADWDFLARLRDRWKGKLVVKGVLDTEDALRIKSAGADAIQVSSHGGRQFESAILPVDALPAIRDAVGPEYPVFFDSGMRCGEDIVKAHALGADFAFLGRPMLYAIAAEGEPGLEKLFEVLEAEIRIALAMMGENSVTKLDMNHIAGPSQI